MRKIENFELEKRYEDEDEIDLVDLLKTIIREKNTVISMVILSIVLAFGFIFYKNNSSHNYGVNISVSTNINNILSLYNFNDNTMNTENEKNTNIINNDISIVLEKSFLPLIDLQEDGVTALNSENIQEIKDVLKEKYDFVKIIDAKKQEYKLFAKVKAKDINTLTDKITEITQKDMNYLNDEFDKNLSELIITYDRDLDKTLDQIKISNEKVMNVIKENFKESSKENLNTNLSIIDPILYTQYQQEIKTLNNLYSKVAILNSIKENSKNILSFSGENKIVSITLDELNSEKGVSNKLILLIGAVLGVFLGIFVAVVKTPLINIFKEIKEENK